ncbi:MAG: ABC transporter substrate-binding protein [Chloroflexi bacterium]|nr:ABC transporter substrate-binding protein [Chloroflexota bacterium]
MRTWKQRGTLGGIVLSIAGLAMACGGGEVAAPNPLATVALQRTATAVAAPRATPGPTTTVAPPPTPRPVATTGLPSVSTPLPAPTPALSTRQPEGKLVVALVSFGVENLDPSTGPFTTMMNLGGPVYDWGLWHDKDGQLAAGVFTNWQQAPDGMSWTFTLRNMAFHNGDPVTSDDVKFAWDRVVRPDSTSTYSAEWRVAVASVGTPSPNTVVVRLKRPWPLMPYFMAAAGGGEGIVYPKAAFERAGGKAFFEKPIGSGPFKFVGRDSGVRALYEASGQRHPYREQPDFRALELLMVPEDSTRMAMLRTGAASIAAITAEGAVTLKKLGSFVFLEVPDSTGSFLRLWGMEDLSQENPLSDVRVRKALQLAINREEIVDKLLNGFGAVPAREIIVPGVQGFDPSWKPVPYDLALARQSLAEAGYKGGFPLKLFSTAPPQAPWNARASEAIAGYWDAVGITVELVPMEYGAWRQALQARPRPRRVVGSYGWILSVKGPEMMRGLIAHYRSTGTSGFLNWPEMDAVVDRAAETLDGQERINLIRKAVDMAFQTYGSIPIAYTPELLGARAATVSGWNRIPLGSSGLSWETVKRR